MKRARLLLHRIVHCYVTIIRHNEDEHAAIAGSRNPTQIHAGGLAGFFQVNVATARRGSIIDFLLAIFKRNAHAYLLLENFTLVY